MKIDVLIPIHYSNRGFLKQSIKSIQLQTVPTRIICVLNGMYQSDNASYQEYLYSLGVEKILICPQKGVSYALNYAIPYLESEYVARQDDDDFSHPERLEILLKNIVSLKIDVIGSNILVMDKDSQVIGSRKYPLSDISCKRTLVSRTCFCHPSVLINTRIFRNHLFPHTGSEDYAFWMSICQNYKFSNVQIPLYYWRRHRNQASSKPIPYLYLKSSIGLACLLSSNILDFVSLISRTILYALWCIYKNRKIDIVHNFLN